MARYYLPQYWAFVEESFTLAYENATNDKEKVRSLLNLGHSYRMQKENELAVATYRRVLEVDPNNRPAQNYIRILSGEKDSFFAQR
jgi:cytochrome c-type biogenesis protein CcmH/NrfG